MKRECTGHPHRNGKPRYGVSCSQANFMIYIMENTTKDTVSDPFGNNRQ